jgi:hypothetical protein
MNPTIRRRAAAPLLALTLLASSHVAAQGRVVRLPAVDRALAGTVAQVYSLGAAEGSDEQMFGAIAGVAFDAADNLYVLDRQSARVMVYGPDGRFRRQIGKKGQGPGELSVPLQMAVAPNGTVVVNDGARQGFSVFGPDGAFVRNVAMEGMLASPAGIVWHPRGGVVSAVRPMLARDGSFTQRTSTVPLLFLPAAGGAPVQLFDIPQTFTTQQNSTGPARNTVTRVRIQGPPRFAPAALYGVLPNGEVALSFTTGYTVRVLDASGHTVRYLQRPMRPRLATEADRERERDRFRENMRTGRGIIRISTGGGGGGGRPAISGAEVEQRVAEMEFADTIAAVRGLRVAPSGRIWVERTAAVFSEDGPLDLITATGEYLGTTTAMKLPDAISRGGLAAFIERDEDDVEHVVVRRLPPGWR